MPRIFISYRRADSIGITGRIYDRMVAAFGEDSIFQDVEDIPFGVDFREYLRDQVAACDVVLVVIGRQWINLQDEHGHRRLDNPADFVRIEVENGLSLEKEVIPVLVDNAKPPQEAELPPSMQDLCYRNAANIRHSPDFDRDIRNLIQHIQALDFRQKINPKKNIPVSTDVGEVSPPLLEWCEVPAGKVTLEAGGYIAKGGQTFEVTAFAIAKYPVTNAQYAQFIDAGGYRNKRWWTDAGWQALEKEHWIEPTYWKDEDFNGANQPVVGVSWYEAAAFCLWLGDVTRQNITLPTEQQWQRAAQGDDGRIYPWGNDWNPTKCNCGKRVRKTTEVAAYEKVGASPYGVVDMSGNVWEWCLTGHKSGKQSLGGIETRVIRGGSWGNIDNFVRAGFRFASSPDVQDDLIGFRCVRLP